MHGASCSTCHIGSGALSCHSRFGWVLPSYFVQVAGPLIWQSKSNIEKIMCVLSSGTKLWRTCKWDINRIHLSYQVWLKLVVLPISSVQSLSRVQLFAPPRTAACKASLSITNSRSLLKLMSIKPLMPSNHLILFHPLLLPSVFLSIRVFSDESVFCIRWPEYWSFSFNISPSNEYSGLISFRMDCLDFLAVHGTLKSLL